MPDFRPPLRDMRFVVYELLNAAEHWQRLALPAEMSQDLADAVLEEAGRINAEVLAPLMRSGDEEGVHWEAGNVRTPAGFPEAFRQLATGGWLGLSGNPVYGGQGMPKLLAVMFDEMTSASNVAFSLYAGLTIGAALLLDAHASEEQKQRYLPQLYSGNWAGVMCLTESHAGSDLGLIRTRAEPQADGSYQLTGNKIFITGGEQDLTDNIVYLVLARIADAPAGTRGISLFIVPKFKVNADGSLGERNAISCGSVEHKMGIHASATCVINLDGAEGVLVGEPGRGLNYMFTMMNFERLAVGLQGLGCAERSRQIAARYARERLQGRGSSGAGPVAIVEHGDVRRMLLTQRAYTEGGRAFAGFVGLQLDLAKFGEGEERAQAEALVALLTPVAKAFMTDLGLESCVAGQQVLGGHGYVREWGVEQLVRDVRIAQVYEGTNGIQGLDLLGRKVLADGGRSAAMFFDFMRGWCESRVHTEPLRDIVGPVITALDRLQSLTLWLVKHAATDADLLNASAVEYLHAFGHVVYGWLWARMAEIALAHPDDEFYIAKLATARFYVQRLLPRVHLNADVIEAGAASVMAMPASAFDS